MRKETKSATPTSVKVIGWIFITVASLMIFSGVMAFLVHTTMKQMEGGLPPIPAETPVSFSFMSNLFNYFESLALIQIIFAIFIIYSGVQFLKLRTWARAALEIISWFALTCVIGFGLLFIYSWFSPSQRIPVPGQPAMFNTMALITGIVVLLVQAVPIIVIIKFLRGTTIRDVFKKGSN